MTFEGILDFIITAIGPSIILPRRSALASSSRRVVLLAPATAFGNKRAIDRRIEASCFAAPRFVAAAQSKGDPATIELYVILRLVKCNQCNCAILD